MTTILPNHDPNHMIMFSSPAVILGVFVIFTSLQALAVPTNEKDAFVSTSGLSTLRSNRLRSDCPSGESLCPQGQYVYHFVLLQ
jgi:hypothetical protein